MSKSRGTKAVVVVEDLESQRRKTKKLQSDRGGKGLVRPFVRSFVRSFVYL